MRRVIATVVGTVIALVLLLSYKTHHLSTSNAAIAPPALTTPSSGSDPSVEPSPAPSVGPSAAPSASAGTPTTNAPKTVAPTTTKKAASTAKRVVQGDAEDTRYGPVQIQVTLTGSKITDIGILQMPQREQRDIEINSYAVPILQQETLEAQSSRINMVSGATYTSVGYIQSLQSALDKAK
jgi:uncharacterized protein with FMN-binding domain